MLSGLFFLLLASGSPIGLRLVMGFLAQRIAFLELTVFDFHGIEGFAFPAAERATENILLNEKGTVRTTGRTLDCNLHGVVFSFCISFIVSFRGVFVNVSRSQPSI
jgi:hypothetical protein